ncbi:GNAT family N-acetyltransferase [Methylobacterium sp. C25]|uniref:GNAT family N-acetyltransferase n=1 Tax=Methylobacterium sp. C25 TaxID=2721622 RepID=UPI001F45E3DA|nr:GNAT family N-acetyltransferase [Methylobacterium sp. C25]MCE4223527.1 GNAT family N-acetyltransferase [Methylobacterium sp. C25]
MTSLAQDLTGAGMIRDSLRDGLTAELFTDLASVEALWRSMETAPEALATPYQRFDWVAAFVAGLEAQDRLRILVLRDAAGRPAALMALLIARMRGFTVARVVGAKHANYHMPLFASHQAAGLSAEEVEAALVRAGQAAGIDAYALDHQPRFWDGSANPLSARGTPCASDAYGLMLGPDAEATVKRSFSGDARKKLRAKERKLVEALGPVDYVQATTPESIAAILEAFYEQKRTRFAAMGIANPYTDDDVRRFIAGATAPCEGRPAIELHALIARNDRRVLATFGGAVNDDRFSGMWTSFDPDPEIGRFSPGDLLLHHLIGQQTSAGRRAFDLGVGEARYKSSICDETIELVEVLIPVTLRGQLFVLAANAASRLKRRIKRSPQLWQAVSRLRKLRRS